MTKAQQADLMLTEMEVNQLEVILIPTPEQKHVGHMIRQATNRNPEWYQGKGLNRKLAKIALNRIRFGLPLSSQTDHKILEIVKEQMIECDISNVEVFPLPRK